MRVIRLENDHGEGPFRSELTLIQDDPHFYDRYYLNGVARHDPWSEPNVKDFPTPSYELSVLERYEPDKVDQFYKVAGNKPGPDVAFGVVDEDQFDHWFSPKQQEIAAGYGFHKAIYDVPDEEAAILTKQVAYRRSAAKLVEKLPLAPGKHA